MPNILIVGNTKPIADKLRGHARWTGHGWIVDQDRWNRIVEWHGGDPTCGNKRDREVKAAIASVVVHQVDAAPQQKMHTVVTPSGAIIKSQYTQQERAEFAKSGIDTDCDDHDLI